MKRIHLPGLLVLFGLTASLHAQPVQKSIVVTNTASYKVTDKPIKIKRTQFNGKIAANLYPVVTGAAGQVIPSQLDDLDGDGTWDELFFVTDIPAKKTIRMSLSWTGSKPAYPFRTSVRFGKRSSGQAPVEPKTSDTFKAGHLPKLLGYQPYQTDGPSWENDRVGFRHYFDGRNAKDLFGKRVSWITPENVGLTREGAVEDNYHELKDWGRDILPVGNSVGLGGYGLISSGNFQRIGVTVDDTVHNVESTDLTIPVEGPSRSVIAINYHNWKAANGHTYQVKENPTIWPGMYAYQNTVQFSGLRGDESLFVGLPKVATDNPVGIIRTANWVVLYTHDKQSYNKEFIIGLAIIVPAKAYQRYGQAPATGQFSSSYYADLKITGSTPLTYYAAGCWELAEPGFKNAAYFKTYLNYLVKQLEAVVQVAVR